jgi:hypothetical protein
MTDALRRVEQVHSVHHAAILDYARRALAVRGGPVSPSFTA